MKKKRIAKQKLSPYDGLEELKFLKQAKGRTPSNEQIMRIRQNAADAETSGHAQAIIHNTIKGMSPKQRKRETLKARGLRLALIACPQLTATLFRDRLEADGTWEFDEDDELVDIRWDRANQSVVISNGRKEERVPLTALDMALSRARRRTT